MATHHGKAGVVKSGANTIAEMVEFSVEETGEVADDTAMGDSARTHLAGLSSWSGQITCHWDETDTNGQQAMTILSSHTMNFYPEGTGAGAAYMTGTGTITNRGKAVALDGVVKQTFQVTGNGALSHTTV